jgi:hypothetical protein
MVLSFCLLDCPATTERSKGQMNIKPKNTRRNRVNRQIVGLQLDGLTGISVIPAERFSYLSMSWLCRHFWRSR